MAEFLADKRREIEARMRELKPSVEEYQQLEAAAAALAGVGPSANRSANGRRRGPGRPRGSRTRAKSSTKRTTAPKTRRRTARRGRPRGSGTRSAQALELVRTQPGITIREMADRMGIAQNYLYRVLPGLQERGQVTRRGRGWHPKGSGAKGS